MNKVTSVSELHDLVFFYRKQEGVSSPRGEQKPAQVTLGQLYDIEKILGAGGFGLVCKAHNRKTG